MAEEYPILDMDIPTISDNIIHYHEGKGWEIVDLEKRLREIYDLVSTAPYADFDSGTKHPCTIAKRFDKGCDKLKVLADACKSSYGGMGEPKNSGTTTAPFINETEYRPPIKDMQLKEIKGLPEDGNLHFEFTAQYDPSQLSGEEAKKIMFQMAEDAKTRLLNRAKTKEEVKA